MKKTLMSVARQKTSRKLLNWSLEHISFAIPVKHLRETKTLIAFHHPKPGYTLHILIVPKQPYGSLMDIPQGETTFLSDLVETVQSLVKEFKLDEGGYRLITNGGVYQEVPHLHFHLVSSKED